MSMYNSTQPGSKVRFAHPNVGNKRSAAALVVGEVYTVHCIQVHSFGGCIWLREVPSNSFSTVQFENVDTPSEIDDHLKQASEAEEAPHGQCPVDCPESGDKCESCGKWPYGNSHADEEAETIPAPADPDEVLLEDAGTKAQERPGEWPPLPTAPCKCPDGLCAHWPAQCRGCNPNMAMQGVAKEPTDRKELLQKIADCLTAIRKTNRESAYAQSDATARRTIREEVGKLELLFAELGSLP